jgi:hypothetical protein
LCRPAALIGDNMTGDPKMMLERFWQENKCLAVWEEGN